MPKIQVDNTRTGFEGQMLFELTHFFECLFARVESLNAVHSRSDRSVVCFQWLGVSTFSAGGLECGGGGVRRFVAGPYRQWQNVCGHGACVRACCRTRESSPRRQAHLGRSIAGLVRRHCRRRQGDGKGVGVGLGSGNKDWRHISQGKSQAENGLARCVDHDPRIASHPHCPKRRGPTTVFCQDDGG